MGERILEGAVVLLLAFAVGCTTPVANKFFKMRSLDPASYESDRGVAIATDNDVRVGFLLKGPDDCPPGKRCPRYRFCLEPIGPAMRLEAMQALGRIASTSTVHVSGSGSGGSRDAGGRARFGYGVGGSIDAEVGAKYVQALARIYEVGEVMQLAHTMSYRWCEALANGEINGAEYKAAMESIFTETRKLLVIQLGVAAGDHVGDLVRAVEGRIQNIELACAKVAADEAPKIASQNAGTPAAEIQAAAEAYCSNRVNDGLDKLPEKVRKEITENTALAAAKSTYVQTQGDLTLAKEEVYSGARPAKVSFSDTQRWNGSNFPPRISGRRMLFEKKSPDSRLRVSYVDSANIEVEKAEFCGYQWSVAFDGAPCPKAFTSFTDHQEIRQGAKSEKQSIQKTVEIAGECHQLSVGLHEVSIAFEVASKPSPSSCAASMGSGYLVVSEVGGASAAPLPTAF